MAAAESTAGKNEKVRYIAEQYFAMIPETNHKVELIDGEIISDYSLNDLVRGNISPKMLAGASIEHQRIAGKIFRKFGDFIDRNNGKCETFYSSTEVKFDEWNVFEPDVLIICDPEKVKEHRIEGAPDLVVEVLSTNKKRDLVDKFHVYSESGVREYWIVDPFNDVTIVYKFGDETDVMSYAFDKPIPVGIWDGRLEITIAERI